MTRVPENQFSLTRAARSACGARKPILISLLVVALFGTALAASTPNTELEYALQAELDRFIAGNQNVPGIALHVEMPRRELSWSGAAGVDEVGGKTPLLPQQPVRIASNTKTFVAAATLRLVENGELELDTPISKYLSAESQGILQRGGYGPDVITVRHLLTHTSGLYDFAEADQCFKIWEDNPKHTWTRREQLQGAMDWGRKVGEPGKVFFYSDTGYILLGEILERLTGKPMGVALRQLVGYEKLGLTRTWLESLEPEPRGAATRAHQYHKKRDTYSDDPSMDLFGGGGLVSTPRDLAVFMRGLFTGRVFVKSATANTMLTTVANAAAGPPSYGAVMKPGSYRMGVEVTKINDHDVYQHGGYWGTFTAYIPDFDISLGAFLTEHNAAYKLRPFLLAGVYKLVMQKRDQMAI